jgi:hypothetical protein
VIRNNDDDDNNNNNKLLDENVNITNKNKKAILNAMEVVIEVNAGKTLQGYTFMSCH